MFKRADDRVQDAHGGTDAAQPLLRVVESADSIERQVEAASQNLLKICDNIETILFGIRPKIENAVACIVAGGHLLFEGPPGGGKTTLAVALSQSFSVAAGRVQGTSDLMPSDIIGGEVSKKDKAGDTYYEVRKGPIFNDFVLLDECNRMPQKTNSAALEAMQEKQVTIGRETFDLSPVFTVMAAQNPRADGSVNLLSDAMLDRFMIRLEMTFPDKDAEMKIIRNNTSRKKPNLPAVMSKDDLSNLREMINDLPLSEDMIDTIVTIVRRTRPDEPGASDLILDKIDGYGVGERAELGLASMVKAFAVMRGSTIPNNHDLGRALELVMSHRIKMTYALPKKQKEDYRAIMAHITQSYDLT